MSEKKRLFIAVDFDVPVLEAIARAVGQMKASAGPLRAGWVKKENLHLTLRFLGETEIERIPAVQAAMQEAVSKTQAFALRVRGTGAFPREHSPRVLWLGIEDASGMLAGLATNLEERARGLGFEPETRVFKPHLTIARVREPRDVHALLEPFRETDFGESTIRQLVLYESRTGPGGSVYSPLVTVPIPAAAISA